MKKYIFLFISSFLFSQQGSISGLILSENAEPMPGANVAIKELGIGAITNEEGFFEISNLEDAAYTLDITYIGYKRVSK